MSYEIKKIREYTDEEKESRVRTILKGESMTKMIHIAKAVSLRRGRDFVEKVVVAKLGDDGETVEYPYIRTEGDDRE